ncbi:type II toxin-antitoxin system death-on-curing family toxin [Wenzhouxiangella marina]|uniref:Death-on-curing protein n=1 Tax=Wenzhouxiangella marina TaxID=1579979 RepID=A0A0K0Y046_9GAMM|nr:type II toxin-antitoxin system death-on-curing family toxin [Wenzhouxiangella marina]AKS43262.1 Death-on-curing protein [Wenzhouxiangella marina]MBB6087051.1 death-on-curing protein [Wenzhouxiangella marina]
MTLLEPVWISARLAVAIHQRQLAEHGGPDGIRDQAMLESALARPLQRHAYGGSDIDIPELAAAYAYGMARNHPFVDGNKRTAYVLCRTFLVLNGWDLRNPLEDRYPTFLALAAGELEESELADWLRRNARPEQVSEGSASYG